MDAETLSPITPRGMELNLDAARPFEAVREARNLLRTTRIGALSTLDPVTGYPYTIFTNIVNLPDGSPFFFAAGLTIHSRNIEADGRISIALIGADKSDAMMCPRMTLSGKAYRISAQNFEEARERYVARFPKSKLYLSLPDAILYRMEIEGLQVNGGPAQNANQVTVKTLKTNLADAEDLLQHADIEVARMNASEGIRSRIAIMANEDPDNWRMASLDPDGIDLVKHDQLARYWFTSRITTREQLQAAIG